MAQAYPNSTFVGFDYHPASIDSARQKAETAGVGDRAKFEVAASKDYPGDNYDLVTFFDCLHDMGDPRGCAAHMRRILSSGGSWMIVEPIAHAIVAEVLDKYPARVGFGSVDFGTPHAVCHQPIADMDERARVLVRWRGVHQHGRAPTM